MQTDLFKTLAVALCAATVATSAMARTFTWSASPEDGNWYNPTNWTPAQVPNSPKATAVFGTTSNDQVTLPADSATDLAGIMFNVPSFGIIVGDGASLTFHKQGVTASAQMDYEISIGTNNGCTITFLNSSQAGDFMIYGAAGGEIAFRDQSIGNAAFNGDGQNLLGDNEGGLVVFYDQSSTGGADFVLNGGATASDKGSEVDLNDDSTAAEGEFDLYDNGTLDLSAHNLPGVTVGEIMGSAGDVLLGSRNLTLAPLFISSTCKAVIQDGGKAGGTGGTLTKMGVNTLFLAGASTYTGGTTIPEGTLSVSNKRGSATGTGPVQVNGGTLTGTGIIAGQVTVGSGASSGGTLALTVTQKNAVALTIQNILTFASDGDCAVTIDDAKKVAGSVSAAGVNITAGAQITLKDSQPATLAPGTQFTLIDNTAATPISGTFTNLPDGATVKVGMNSYLANYEGGDGNDLVLTVQ